MPKHTQGTCTPYRRQTRKSSHGLHGRLENVTSMTVPMKKCKGFVVYTKYVRLCARAMCESGRVHILACISVRLHVCMCACVCACACLYRACACVCACMWPCIGLYQGVTMLVLVVRCYEGRKVRASCLQHSYSLANLRTPRSIGRVMVPRVLGPCLHRQYLRCDVIYRHMSMSSFCLIPVLLFFPTSFPSLALVGFGSRPELFPHALTHSSKCTQRRQQMNINHPETRIAGNTKSHAWRALHNAKTELEVSSRERAGLQFHSDIQPTFC